MIERQSLRRSQQGLSLVEIMVALLLGAVITVGIVQMFTANRTTYQVNMGQARLQENARFAMDFITGSMRMAGYRGCSNRTDIVNVVDGPANATDQFDMDDAIVGHTGQGNGWSPALSSLPADIDTTAIAPGTDVLVMRTVLDDGISFTGQTPANSSQSFVTLPLDCTSNDCAGYEPGTVIMASDCVKTAVFMITNSTGQPNSDDMLVVHNTGTTIGGFSNALNPIEQLGDSFNEDASVFRIGSETFYIAPGAGTNNAGDTPLALWRKRGQEAPVELVEGVQGLRLLYGEDTDGDRVPNQYRPIHQVGNRENIVTIRVTISATSVDAVADGNTLQRDFTKTIAIRNRI